VVDLFWEQDLACVTPYLEEFDGRKKLTSVRVSVSADQLLSDQFRQHAQRPASDGVCFAFVDLGCE